MKEPELRRPPETVTKSTRTKFFLFSWIFSFSKRAVFPKEFPTHLSFLLERNSNMKKEGTSDHRLGSLEVEENVGFKERDKVSPRETRKIQEDSCLLENGPETPRSFVEFE